MRKVWRVPLPPLKILVAWLCMGLTFYLEQTWIKRVFENCWNFYSLYWFQARDSRKIKAKASAWQPTNLVSQRRGQQWQPPYLSHERVTLKKNLTQRKYRQYLQRQYPAITLMWLNEKGMPLKPSSWTVNSMHSFKHIHQCIP